MAQKGTLGIGPAIRCRPARPGLPGARLGFRRSYLQRLAAAERRQRDRVAPSAHASPYASAERTPSHAFVGTRSAVWAPAPDAARRWQSGPPHLKPSPNSPAMEFRLG